MRCRHSQVVLQGWTLRRVTPRVWLHRRVRAVMLWIERNLPAQMQTKLLPLLQPVALRVPAPSGAAALHVVEWVLAAPERVHAPGLGMHAAVPASETPSGSDGSARHPSWRQGPCRQPHCASAGRTEAGILDPDE